MHNSDAVMRGIFGLGPSLLLRVIREYENRMSSEGYYHNIGEHANQEVRLMLGLK